MLKTLFNLVLPHICINLKEKWMLSSATFLMGGKTLAQLPGEAVGAPSLKAVNARLDGEPGQPELVGGSPAFHGGLETGRLPTQAIL